MPRSIVLGNGNLLVGHDFNGQIRDLYYDRVGQENHTSGQAQRVGVFAEGRMHWITQENSWRITINYVPETLIARIEATKEAIGLKIVFEDFVYNETDIFIRKVEVVNLWRNDREVRFFFHNDLEVGGYEHGVTAFYHPDSQSVIHYRGPRVFLFNGMINENHAFTYTVGMTRYNGFEGTWRDAEDGELAQNPIEHGRVDSVLGFRLQLRSKSTATGHYWMVAGKTLDEVLSKHEDVLKRSPAHLYQTTRDYWHAWVNKKPFSFYNLTKEQICLFKTSLLVMRIHTDNRGAMIASSDSSMLQHGKDTYAYMWPRDAAYTAMAFTRAGYDDIARTFFTSAVKLITDDGYFRHKYLPDGSYGSSWHPWIEHGHNVLPIQEDETAIMLYALWVYYDVSRAIEFIETIYNPFIKRTANFLVDYRHHKTKMPLQSYDLWEEHRSVSTYTTSSVVGGLEAAANFAKLLGKKSDEQTYAQAAADIRKGIKKYLIDSKTSTPRKGIFFDHNGQMRQDNRADMSSFFGLLQFNIFTKRNKILQTAARRCKEKLWGGGGMLRYEGDKYFQEISGASNPWIITTLWQAMFLTDEAKKESDLKPVRDIFEWVVKRAQPCGLLPEQVHPISNAPVSASPLVWSHAVYVEAVVKYLEKLEELGVCKACLPKR